MESSRQPAYEGLKMSAMSNIYQTIAEYLDQGDNPYRIASVLNIPVEWVHEIENELLANTQSYQDYDAMIMS